MKIAPHLLSAWRFVGSVFLCCTLLIGAIMLIGHLLPSPADSTVLARNPCALPCFSGVTPGKTTYAQAIDILSKTVQASADNAASISFSLLDNEGRTSLASVNFGGDGIVESVRVIPIDLFARTGELGDLLLAGQKPNHVFHTCDYLLPVRFLITFGERDELVAEIFPLGSLAPDSRVTLFDLSTAASRSLYDATSSFGCTVRTDWLGLAPLWKYFAVDKPPV
ncbi:MAG: hypothetical protein ABI700_25305 [Chloroflexota bacterium]